MHDNVHLNQKEKLRRSKWKGSLVINGNQVGRSRDARQRQHSQLTDIAVPLELGDFIWCQFPGRSSQCRVADRQGLVQTLWEVAQVIGARTYGMTMFQPALPCGCISSGESGRIF